MSIFFNKMFLYLLDSTTKVIGFFKYNIMQISVDIELTFLSRYFRFQRNKIKVVSKFESNSEFGLFNIFTLAFLNTFILSYQ